MSLTLDDIVFDSYDAEPYGFGKIVRIRGMFDGVEYGYEEVVKDPRYFNQSREMMLTLLIKSVERRLSRS